MSIQLGFQAEDFTMKTWRAVAAEFIATGLFVFLGTGSVVVAQAALVETGVVGNAPPVEFVIAVALAHGLAFALLVAATAKISGGHINPAVTFAAALTGKIKISTAGLYIVGQLIAAILGSLLLKGILAGPVEMGLGAHSINIFVADASTGVTSGMVDQTLGNGAGAGLLLEAVLTFVLVFVVFATAMDLKGLGQLAPMAIGLAVLVDNLVGIPLTGASMNPARSFGPAVVANIWDDHWVYWLGPLIGAGAAGLIYQYVFLEREDE